MPRSNLRNTTQFAVTMTLCGSLFGCSEDPVNIGDGQNDVDKGELASYAASWDGYVEAFTFLSGSDRVRVSLDESGIGWLQVGDGEALPPASDPNVGYPPAARGLPPNSIDGLEIGLYDGIRYPLVNVRIESERIRFEIETRAAFASFCALQTPLQLTDEPGKYGCFVSTTTENRGDGTCGALLEPGGEYVPMDCAKVNACVHACECDAQACSSGAGLDVPLDAALDDSGDELTGTILLQDDGVGARTIRLQRR